MVLHQGLWESKVTKESQTTVLYSINSHVFNPLRLLDSLWMVSPESKERIEDW